MFSQAPRQFQREHWPAFAIRNFLANAEAFQQTSDLAHTAVFGSCLGRQGMAQNYRVKYHAYGDTVSVRPKRDPIYPGLFGASPWSMGTALESGRCRLLKQLTTYQASTLRTQRCTKSPSPHRGAALRCCARSKFWCDSCILLYLDGTWNSVQRRYHPVLSRRQQRERYGNSDNQSSQRFG